MTILDLSWIGKRVKTSPVSSVYKVRAISTDGQRAFLSLVIDPKFVCTEPAEMLVIHEPIETSCPNCEAPLVFDPGAVEVDCRVCGQTFLANDLEAAMEAANE